MFAGGTMRWISRHLGPVSRSRRRVPLVLIIALFLSVLSFSFFVHQHPYQKAPPGELVPISRLPASVKQVLNRSGVWPVDEKGRSLKNQFLVLDWTGFFGSGGNEGDSVSCPSSNTTFTWTRQQNRAHEVDFVISHDAQSGAGIPFNRLQLNENQQQYTMAFIMESEVHSSTGNAWSKFHFKMSYNLDDSYPEPATYFDMNIHLIDLLTPPVVPFEEKEKSADVVWIISNCNAHNGREGFVGRLMKEIKVHSYGSCLNNRQGYGTRMTDNIDAYKKYKFVIAIENSNCLDYVTEKLVKAVASGSIPIVAGRNGRPDHRRYMPEHSYINVFDYPSISALAADLKRIAGNKTLYESYLWYRKHQKNLAELQKLPLESKLKEFAEVVGANATMIIEGIAGKEKSENKICKLIRFVRQTPWREIAEHQRTGRPDAGTACLPGQAILSHFNTAQSNSSQAANS